MKVPLIRIIWIVATLVIYLGFKTYNFRFPLVLIKLVPLVLLWFAVRRDGIDFLSGPKNYLLFLVVIFSGGLLEHLVYGVLPPDGFFNRFISIVISLAVLTAVVFSAKWLKEKKLPHP